MKVLLIIAFLFCFNSSFSQIISGYVFDEITDKPLDGALVYLDGTTLSATTTANGFFKLATGQKYNSSLVISFIGYKTKRVEDPYKYSKPIKVMMQTDVIGLDEVVITNAGSFTRKQMLRVFREQFLGTTSAGESCIIENEYDIVLYFDLSTNTLKAKASKPICITNNWLEYEISFDLIDFHVVYDAETLANFAKQVSFFSGTTLFTDISKEHSADEKRKKAYLGSYTHFMRTLATEDWKQQDYMLYADNLPTNPKDFFKVTDSLDYKKVALIDIPQSVKSRRVGAAAIGQQTKKIKNKGKFSDVNLVVIYRNELQTQLNFNNGFLYVDKNGLFFPLNEITFGGYMGNLKVGELLPVDYIYTP